MSNANSYMVGGHHYKKLTVEPWAAMEAWLPKEQFLGFLHGNAIKYLARANHKNGIEDMRKAKHYLEKYLEVAVSETPPQTSREILFAKARERMAEKNIA